MFTHTIAGPCVGHGGDRERAVIDWWHAKGVRHIAKFADEPRSQSEWDAWGYHLHGP